MNVRTILSLGSLCAIAAGAVIACSEDDKKNNAVTDSGTTDTDAGGGTDSGTSTDSASTGDSQFAQQDTGTVDAGACTSADPMFASGFQASCATCVAAECCAEVKACEGIADCKAFAQCYAGCIGDGGTQGSCTGPCIAGKDGGAIQSVYNQFILCGGNKCNNDGGASAPKCPF